MDPKSHREMASDEVEPKELVCLSSVETSDADIRSRLLMKAGSAAEMISGNDPRLEVTKAFRPKGQIRC